MSSDSETGDSILDGPSFSRKKRKQKWDQEDLELIEDAVGISLTAAEDTEPAEHEQSGDTVGQSAAETEVGELDSETECEARRHKSLEQEDYLAGEEEGKWPLSQVVSQATLDDPLLTFMQTLCSEYQIPLDRQEQLFLQGVPKEFVYQSSREASQNIDPFLTDEDNRYYVSNPKKRKLNGGLSKCSLSLLNYVLLQRASICSGYELYEAESSVTDVLPDGTGIRLYTTIA